MSDLLADIEQIIKGGQSEIITKEHAPGRTREEIIADTIEQSPIEEMDELAKEAGFLVGISGELYEKQLTLNTYLYIEKIEGTFTLYRPFGNGKDKVFIEQVSFRAALDRAVNYLAYRKKKGL